MLLRGLAVPYGVVCPWSAGGPLAIDRDAFAEQRRHGFGLVPLTVDHGGRAIANADDAGLRFRHHASALLIEADVDDAEVIAATRAGRCAISIGWRPDYRVIDDVVLTARMHHVALLLDKPTAAPTCCWLVGEPETHPNIGSWPERFDSAEVAPAPTGWRYVEGTR